MKELSTSSIAFCKRHLRAKKVQFIDLFYFSLGAAPYLLLLLFDCIHQMILQHPDRFEFKTAVLYSILEEYYIARQVDIELILTLIPFKDLILALSFLILNVTK